MTNISNKKADWAWAWCERPARENFRTFQAKVSNSNKEKNANYFLGIKNVECFYLTCALLSGWCYDLTCAMLKCKVSPQLKFSTY